MSIPNIIVITAHDLGWADLGCYGNPFHHTPNFDRLANDGMRFTQAYSAAPICNPSRAAIFTGQYPARYNLTGQPGYKKDRSNRKLLHPDFETELPEDIRTCGHELSGSSYRCAVTGVIGPGLGGKDLSHFGFDYLRSSNDHEITDVAVRFIAEQSRADRPFYLQVNHNWVHTPLCSQEERIARFRERADDESPWNSATYAAVLEELDESVGCILEAIEATGRAEDTVVMFLSDHGGYLGYCEADREEFAETEKVTSNAPLREGKASLYEGGVRIPWIIRWPSKIEAGIESDSLVNQVDLYPTLMEIAGLELPSRVDLDGLSLGPVLNNTASDLADRTFYWHWPHYRRTRAGPGPAPSSAVRDGDWKLLEFFEDGRTELYNLREDISESRNLANFDHGKRDELLSDLRRWRESVGAQLPIENPEYA